MNEIDNGDKIDRTPVKCPNKCLFPLGFGKAVTASRQFLWVDKAKADVGTRNYCEQCGAELMEVQDD